MADRASGKECMLDLGPVLNYTAGSEIATIQESKLSALITAQLAKCNDRLPTDARPAQQTDFADGTRYYSYHAYGLNIETRGGMVHSVEIHNPVPPTKSKAGTTASKKQSYDPPPSLPCTLLLSNAETIHFNCQTRAHEVLSVLQEPKKKGHLANEGVIWFDYPSKGLMIDFDLRTVALGAPTDIWHRDHGGQAIWKSITLYALT